MAALADQLAGFNRRDEKVRELIISIRPIAANRVA